MAKQTGRGSGAGSGRTSASRRRQQKSPRTIDLEAKEIEDAESMSGTESAAEEAIATTEAGADRNVETVAGSAPAQGGEDSGGEQTARKPQGADTGGDEPAAEAESSGSPAGGEDTSKTGREPQDPTRDGERATAPERVVEVRKGGSLLGMLLSGLIGGGAVLAGNAVIQSGAVSQVPVIGSWLQGSGAGDASGAVASEQMAALESRVADLAARLDAAEASSGQDSAGMEISAIEARLAELEAAGGNGEIETLRSALADVEARAEEAMSAAAQAAAGLSEGGGSAGDPQILQSAIAPLLAPIEERLAAIEAGNGEQAEGSAEALTQLQASAQQLTGDVEALSSRVDDASSRMETLSGSVGALDQRLAGLETRIETEVVPSLGEIDAAAEAAVRGQAVARSVSARGLAAVLENGGQFTSELASAEALLGENEAVSALKPLARRGVASQERLQAAFDEAADAVLSTTSRPEEGEGILTRLMGSAQSLVKVRPAGPVEGDTPAAILSRMEAAISDGNYQAALDEQAQLPQEGRDASSGLAALISDRIEAERLIGQVIMSLGSSPAGQEG